MKSKLSCILLLTVLIFSVFCPAALAASYYVDFNPDTIIAAPNPLDLANQIPEISEYINTNGTDALCYYVLDYGPNYAAASHQTYKVLDEANADRYFIDWYYVGKSIPAARYLYVYYDSQPVYNGEQLAGSAKYRFLKNASSGIYNPGFSFRVQGQPLAAIAFNDSNGTYSVLQNTFGIVTSENTSSYSTYFARVAGSRAQLDSTNTYMYSESLYPCLLGVCDPSYDVSNFSETNVFFYLKNDAYSIVSATPRFYVPTLDGYTWTFEFSTADTAFLNDFTIVFTAALGFFSDVITFCTDTPVLLLLMSIPLVPFVFAYFMRFLHVR